MNSKVCSTCSKNKLISEFSQRTNGKSHGVCKSCHNNYNRQHYQRNKDLYITKAKKRTVKQRKIQRELLAEIKSVPCKDCGVRYPSYVMQFDHKSNKHFNISDCIGQVGWNTMKAEIEKCDVVCANCHAKRTHQRQNI